jgi:hypothetical protein
MKKTEPQRLGFAYNIIRLSVPDNSLIFAFRAGAW